MKKKACELVAGEKILVGGETLEINAVENSDISKQGTKKTRLEAHRTSGEKIVLIRPADYPFEIL